MKQGVTKQQLIDSLAETLRLTRVGISGLILIQANEPEDAVRIIYEDGSYQRVCIAGDSGIAIIRDVCRAIG